MSDQTTSATAPSRITHFECESEDPIDLMNNRLYQINAVSSLLYGEGFKTFSNLAGDLQEGILWALHSLISDANIAATRLRRGGA